MLLTENTVTYRRAPGPPLGRLAPAPTLWAGTRCWLALTPGRPPQNGGLRPGDGLARGRSVSGRPGGPWISIVDVYVAEILAAAAKPLSQNSLAGEIS